MEILLIIYIIASWWAYGVIFEDHIRIEFSEWFFEKFFKRLMLGIVFGFILIPIALIKRLLFKKQ